MLHKSIIKLAKKMNIEIINPDFRRENSFAMNGRNYCCEWHTQGETAHCIKIRKFSDKDDIYSDYSAGFFTDRLKDIERYLIGDLSA